MTFDLKKFVVAASIACGSVVAAWACSPSTVAPADAGSDDSIAKACTDYGFAYCTRLQACSTTALEERFKDFASCQQIFTQICTGTSSAPDSAETPSTEESCAQAFPNWTCTDFLVSRNAPPACTKPTGPRAIGSSCSNAQQCQSGYCFVALGAACGTCQPEITIGDSCAQSMCGTGLVCEGANSTCVAPAEIGSPCSPTQPCVDGLNCLASTGVCAQGAATLGAACSFNGAGCNLFNGLSCNAQTGQCETTALAAPGQACGIVANQSVSCIAGTCVRGVCVGEAGYHEACDTDAGPSCISATHCISLDGGTSGTCEVYGINACP